jgi:hypothetical protein
MILTKNHLSNIRVRMNLVLIVVIRIMNLRILQSKILLNHIKATHTMNLITLQKKIAQQTIIHLPKINHLLNKSHHI